MKKEYARIITAVAITLLATLGAIFFGYLMGRNYQPPENKMLLYESDKKQNSPANSKNSETKINERDDSTGE